jgi:hypothetical protein
MTAATSTSGSSAATSELYDAFFSQRDLIPAGRFCEVAYETLERDPVGTIASIYQSLNLPGFDGVEGELRQYVASIASYRKNTHPRLPDHLRAQIDSPWRRCFEEWGYPMAQSKPATAA